MTVCALFQRFGFGDIRLLRQGRERIEFAKEGNHRAAFAPFAHYGCWNVGHVLGDAKALMCQLVDVQSD